MDDSHGSKPLALGKQDIFALVTSALVAACGAALAVLGNLTPDHLSQLGPLAPLATALCMVGVNSAKEFIQAGDFTWLSWQKLGRSLMIAGGGAVIAYLQSLLTGGETTASAIAVWAVLVNIGRKFFSDTRPAAPKVG